MQLGRCFAQCNDNVVKRMGGAINPHWILLDSCSTLSCVCSPLLVSNIRECSPGNNMQVYTNGGIINYHKEADLKLLPFTVYYKKQSMANVLFVKDVADHFRITMDMFQECCMLVHLYNGSTLKFHKCGDGLYYLDTSCVISTNSSVSAYCFLQTVNSNKTFFTWHEIEGANNARLLQQHLWWPTDKTFKQIITTNQLQNCLCTNYIHFSPF